MTIDVTGRTLCDYTQPDRYGHAGKFKICFEATETANPADGWTKVGKLDLCPWHSS